MTHPQRTDPADGQNTLALRVCGVAFGLAVFGFAAHAAWSEWRDVAHAGTNSLTELSCVGLAALIFLTFGALMISKGLQERRRRRGVPDTTTAAGEPSDGARDWEPGPAVTGHRGEPLNPGRDYFVPPPPEIGEVVSAYTSLARTDRPRGGVVLAALGFCALGFLCGWALMRVVEPDDGPARLVVGGFAGLFGAVIGWGRARFKHACSYVGTEGVARFVCVQSRERVTHRETFLFRTAADLRTSETRRYTNGVYQGTDFHFDWTDAAGAECFRITGTYPYHALGNNPWTDMPHQWARAAETAWSRYRLARLDADLERDGAVRFALLGADRLAVGPGVLEVSRGEETVRCAAADIEEFSLAGGAFTLGLGGGPEGPRGPARVYKISYDEIANVKLFLLVLDRLLGITFGV
jgi:hypothetical protein